MIDIFKDILRDKKYAPILFVFLLLGGCGTGGQAYSPPVVRPAAVVDMGFSSYSPLMVTIHAGDTVEWRNRSLIKHTVTDDPKLAAGKAESSMLPLRASAFNSGPIQPGQAYTHRFTVPGTYRYFCRYHESHGMVGTVIVERY